MQGDGIDNVIAAAKVAAEGRKAPSPARFSPDIEALIEHLEADLPQAVAPQLKRYYAIKYLEHDEKVLAELGGIEDLDGHVRAVEARFGDRADAVISNERYNFITSFINEVQKKTEPDEETIEAMGEGFEPDPESAETQAALKAFEAKAASEGVIAEYTTINEENLTQTDYFVYVGEQNEAKAQALADARNDEIAAEGRSEAAEAVVYNFDGEVASEDNEGEMVPQGVSSG